MPRSPGTEGSLGSLRPQEQQPPNSPSGASNIRAGAAPLPHHLRGRLGRSEARRGEQGSLDEVAGGGRVTPASLSITPMNPFSWGEPQQALAFASARSFAARPGSCVHRYTVPKPRKHQKQGPSTHMEPFPHPLPPTEPLQCLRKNTQNE